MDDSLKKNIMNNPILLSSRLGNRQFGPYIEMLADDFTFQFPGIKLTDATYLRMGSV